MKLSFSSSLRSFVCCLAVCCLASCVGVQHIAYHPDGTVRSATQVDAILAEGEASAREIVLPNGTRITSVQQKYDGTRVAGGILDMVTTTGLARIAEPALIKGTKDPNIIPHDSNVIPKDPNVIPKDPNIILE